MRIRFVWTLPKCVRTTLGGGWAYLIPYDLILLGSRGFLLILIAFSFFGLFPLISCFFLAILFLGFLEAVSSKIYVIMEDLSLERYPIIINFLDVRPNISVDIDCCLGDLLQINFDTYSGTGKSSIPRFHTVHISTKGIADLSKGYIIPAVKRKEMRLNPDWNFRGDINSLDWSWGSNNPYWGLGLP